MWVLAPPQFLKANLVTTSSLQASPPPSLGRTGASAQNLGLRGHLGLVHRGGNVTRSLASVVCVCVLSRFSCVQICATLWTLACQAPPSMGFSRQDSWSGLSHPPPGDLPNLGILFQNRVVWRLLRREWAYEKFLKTFNSGTGWGGHRCIGKCISLICLGDPFFKRKYRISCVNHLLARSPWE